MRTLNVILMAALGLILSGCTFHISCHSNRRCCPKPCGPRAPRAQPEAPVPEIPGPTSMLYNGADGSEAQLEETLAGWLDADLVAFGELHGNAVGAKTELQVLQLLAKGERPLALAMEFLERDTQPVVDAYLAGELEEMDFLKQARQSKAYPTSHRALIEFCKANQIPVIAANGPRKLVSGYRKSEGTYEEYLAGLTEEERATLPEETEELDDDYKARFLKLMGPKRGPTYFRSQSLWDDSMAASMVDFRAEHPNHRILFIVGGFHVTRGEGTITKYAMRRGKDDVRLIIMSMDNEKHLPFDEEEIGLGDLVLNVPQPKRKPMGKMKAPKGPNPHKKMKPSGVS
jgi:uncharacterized iron-regulated protein